MNKQNKTEKNKNSFFSYRKKQKKENIIDQKEQLRKEHVIIRPAVSKFA